MLKNKTEWKIDIYVRVCNKLDSYQYVGSKKVPLNNSKMMNHKKDNRMKNRGLITLRATQILYGVFWDKRPCYMTPGQIDLFCSGLGNLLMTGTLSNVKNVKY